MFPDVHYILALIPPILFGVGLYFILSKENLIQKLLGVELILNAANLNLIIMNQQFNKVLQGQLLVLFVITIAAAEVAVALAILIKIFKKSKEIVD